MELNRIFVGNKVVKVIICTGFLNIAFDKFRCYTSVRVVISHNLSVNTAA